MAARHRPSIVWDPTFPLRELPDGIASPFVEEAGVLQDELRRRLRVVLVPAPIQKHSGHKIRVADESNPVWYRDLWHERSFRRRRGRRRLGKLDSSTKRTRIAAALDRLCDGKDGAFAEMRGAIPYKYHYDTLLRRLIRSRLIDGYQSEEWGPVSPNKEVRDFFEQHIVPSEALAYV